jgi:hypothetical protein
MVVLYIYFVKLLFAFPGYGFCAGCQVHTAGCGPNALGPGQSLSIESRNRHISDQGHDRFGMAYTSFGRRFYLDGFYDGLIIMLLQ